MESITSDQAFARLTTDSQAILVDVRTPAEWQSVGIAEDASFQGRSHHLTLDVGNAAESAATIVETLTQALSQQTGHEAAELKQQTALIFMCRGGARSALVAEAAAAAGFANSYNMVDGFEGSPMGAGWRATAPHTVWPPKAA